MRRLILDLALLLLLAAVVPVAAQRGPPHSPNVAEAGHEPSSPARGQPVALHVVLRDDANITKVVAQYCRVEGYACAPGLAMTSSAPRRYEATIAWSARFFQSVRSVGYDFEVHYANGSTERSPIANYPDRPANLPAAADVYYFYSLPPEKGIPAPSLAIVLVAFALVAAWRPGRG